MQGLTLRERQFALREEVILDAAHEAMAEFGYSAMNMDDVAARAGVSKATLYQHFPSKEELAVRVIVRAIHRLEVHIRDQDELLPAIKRLENAMKSVIDYRFGGRRPDLNAALTRLHPFLRSHALFKEQHDRLVATLAVLVEEAKAEGEIAAHHSTSLIVTMLLSCARDADYETLVASGQCTVEELKKTLVSTLFDGLRVR